MQKLNPINFGLATGISFGLYVAIIGILAWLFDWGMPIVDLISSVYIGYNASLAGSLIGGVWAFIDFFLGALIIAWIYNKLQARGNK